MLTDEEARKFIREKVKEVLENEEQKQCDNIFEHLADPKQIDEFSAKLKEEIRRYSKRRRILYISLIASGLLITADAIIKLIKFSNKK